MLSDAMTKPRPNEFKNFDGLPLLKVYLQDSLESRKWSEGEKKSEQTKTKERKGKRRDRGGRCACDGQRDFLGPKLGTVQVLCAQNLSSN